jgi:two-component system phosphate regulon sensor histidine kinase PhoR
MQSRKGPLRIIYVLSVYVVFQLVWWGYHIIQLTQETDSSESVQRRIWMILGEGSVFALILIFGIIKLRQLYKRDELSREKERNFLLAVTHELKTPIASNKLAIETIKNRDLDKELTEKMLNNALNSNIRLEELVEKILLSTNVNESSKANFKSQFNLNKELDRIVKINFNSLEELVDVETYFNADCSLKMNLLEFETIVNNVLQNAIKYQLEGDKITLRTELSNSSIIISIEDQGPGIPDNEKQKVFDKFYRIGNEMTRTTKGTGLGLYLVKELIERNNGSILIADNTPNGSIFNIQLPISTS